MRIDKLREIHDKILQLIELREKKLKTTHELLRAIEREIENEYGKSNAQAR